MTKKNNLLNCGLCSSDWLQGKTERKRKEWQVPKTLIENWKKLWNMKRTAIPIVTGALNTVTRGLLQGLKNLKIKGKASKETIIWRLQVQPWLQASNNTEILNTCTRLWLTESKQATPVDSIKDVVRSFVKVPEFDKHLKKAGGDIDRNVVEITIKMKTIVRKPLMIKIHKLCLRNLDNTGHFVKAEISRG